MPHCYNSTEIQFLCENESLLIAAVQFGQLVECEYHVLCARIYLLPRAFHHLLESLIGSHVWIFRRVIGRDNSPIWKHDSGGHVGVLDGSNDVSMARGVFDQRCRSGER